jgi:hypothetical protein
MKELGSEIVDSRGLYPELSLGQLYSDLPTDLRQAHLRNDEYVGSLYGIADPANFELTVRKLMSSYVEKLESNAN